MVNFIQIKNFQSHKDTFIEFDPGVNVIVGGSDSGKSAIIRALKWLLYNKPGGDSFRSNWGGDTIVVIEFADGNYVERFKANSKQAYILNDLRFEAFGTSVPDEIMKVLNMSEVNLQQQLDSPFLLSKSPGEVAVFFNSLADLSGIDKANKQIQSWLRAIQEKYKYEQERVEKLKEELTSYLYLEHLDIQVKVLEDMEKHRANLLSRWSNLNAKIKAYRTTAVELEEIEVSLCIEKQVIKIDKLVTEKNYIAIRITTLKTRIELFRKNEKAINQFKRLVIIDQKVGDILVWVNNRTAVTNKINQVSGLITQFNRYRDELIPLNTKKLNNLEANFKTNFPEVCPLCGTPIKR